MKYIFLIIMMFIVACTEYIPHKHINFLQSFSPDISHYNLYVSEAPEKVSVKSKSYIIKDGFNTGEFDELTSRISVDLTELLGSGEYYIGITAIGPDNEESKMKLLNNIIIIE